MQSRQDRPNDLILRAGGLLLLAIGALAILRTMRRVQLPPHHPASAAELALAAVSVIALSLGACLATLGAHLFDEIEISARWARRDYDADLVRPAARGDCPKDEG